MPDQDNLPTFRWNATDYHRSSSAQQQWESELIQKLALTGTERVLDIGCGDGKITAELSDAFPSDKETFEAHLAILEQELADLDQEIQERLHSVETRIFLVSHPAFAYFCRDYDCRQLSVEHEGKEPRPRELEETLHTAIETHATLAIALPQHNNKGAQLIAEKLRIPVRYVDPYAADYFDTMRKLSELIANPYATAPGI